MLGRLKKIVKASSSDPDYNLRKLGLNQTHAAINLEQILDIYKTLFLQKQVKLIDELLLATKSKSWIMQLKAYIIIHHLLIKIFPNYLEQKLLMAKFQQTSELDKQDIKQWIRMNITKQYHTYLVKLCINHDLYSSCAKKEFDSLFEADFIQQITKSFKVLNMVVGIMRNQINFCKMGRYYPQYLVIFELYMIYLKDVKLYYRRIKSTMNFVLNSHQYLNNQQLIHGFHFINQALVTSDRQYQFFYNRYFYEKMGSFEFPIFYKLDHEKYKKLIKNIQKKGLKIGELSLKDNKKRKHKQRINQNKTLDTFEHTAETVQDRCRTVGVDGFNEDCGYQEVVHSLQI